MMISITFSWISRHLHVYYHILINNIYHRKGAGGRHMILLGGTGGVLLSATTEPWLTVSSFPRPLTSGKPELQARN